jgi:hypothetical protein
VFDEFGRTWWQLAAYWGWGHRNRFLRRATGQKQATHQQGFPHALFSLARARLSMAILVTALAKTIRAPIHEAQKGRWQSESRNFSCRLSETFHVVCDIHLICLPHKIGGRRAGSHFF